MNTKGLILILLLIGSLFINMPIYSDVKAQNQEAKNEIKPIITSSNLTNYVFLSLRDSYLNNTFRAGNQWMIQVVYYPNYDTNRQDQFNSNNASALFRLQTSNINEQTPFFLHVLSWSSQNGMYVSHIFWGNSTTYEHDCVGGISSCQIEYDTNSYVHGYLKPKIVILTIWVDNLNHKLWFSARRDWGAKYWAPNTPAPYTWRNISAYNTINPMNLTIGYGYVYYSIVMLRPTNVVNASGYMNGQEWVNSTSVYLMQYEYNVTHNNLVHPLNVTNLNAQLLVNLQPYTVTTWCNNWFDLESKGRIYLYAFYQKINTVKSDFNIPCMDSERCSSKTTKAYAFNNTALDITALGFYFPAGGYPQLWINKTASYNYSLMLYFAIRLYSDQVFRDHPNSRIPFLLLYSYYYNCAYNQPLLYWIGIVYNSTGDRFELFIKFGDTIAFNPDDTGGNMTELRIPLNSTILNKLYSILVVHIDDHITKVYLNNTLAFTDNRRGYGFFNTRQYNCMTGGERAGFFNQGYIAMDYVQSQGDYGFRAKMPMWRYQTNVYINYTFNQMFVNNFNIHMFNYTRMILNGTFYPNSNDTSYFLMTNYTASWYQGILIGQQYKIYPNNTNSPMIGSQPIVFAMYRDQRNQTNNWEIMVGNLDYRIHKAIDPAYAQQITVTFKSDVNGLIIFGLACQVTTTTTKKTNTQGNIAKIGWIDIMPWIYLILPLAFMLLLMQFDRRYWLLGLIIGFIVTAIIFPINWAFVIILSIFAVFYYKR